MTNDHDMTGSWRGHYEQHGGRHGIGMTVAQKGSSFVGRMRDDDTLLSSASEIAVGEKTPFEITLQAETLGHLPDSSIVEGTVKGRRVTFDKRYEGTHTISTWIEGHAAEHLEIPDHRVRYEGVLDRDGRRLRGQWSISGNGEFTDAIGSFELVRV